MPSLFSPLHVTLLSAVAVLALFGLFTAVFARSDIGYLLAGMLRLVVSLFTSPIRYVRACALRVAEYFRGARQDASTDRQYLLQRVLLVSNAVIFLVAVAILAFGVVGVWRVVYPIDLQEHREEAQKAIDRSVQAVVETEKRIEKITTELGGETEADRRTKQLVARSAQLEGQLKTAGESLNRLDDSTREHGNKVSNYLRSQESPYAGEPQIRNAAAMVNDYLQKASVPEPGRQTIQNYVNVWADSHIAARQLREAQSSNPREEMAREKTGLEARVVSLKDSIKELDKELSLGNLYKGLRFELGLLSLAMTYLSFTLFVWMAGLLVELMGLSVDIAQNLRLVRGAVERAAAPSAPRPPSATAATA
jgi:hypothetical protein